MSQSLRQQDAADADILTVLVLVPTAVLLNHVSGKAEFDGPNTCASYILVRLQMKLFASGFGFS